MKIDKELIDKEVNNKEVNNKENNNKQYSNDDTEGNINPSYYELINTMRDMMTKLDQSYTEHNKGNEFTRQYPCRDTVTGVFTDCGPYAANIPCYRKFNY